MTVNISNFTFEFWDGPPPGLPTRKVVTSHRPGVSGVAHQVLGTWGDTFSVVLTSHHANFILASDFYKTLTNDLIGMGPVYVTWEGSPWSGAYSVMYNVEAIELVDIRAAIYLAGPGYAFPEGVSLVTRFTLTPQAV
jgi:hypothetical protein